MPRIKNLLRKSAGKFMRSDNEWITIGISRGCRRLNAAQIAQIFTSPNYKTFCENLRGKSA
jgi:hypothetical protein